MRARFFADLPFGLAVFGIAVLAYANAMPAVAVHDDAYFVPSRYTLSAESLGSAFSDDVWAAVGARSGLYRPLMLASIAVDGALWSDAAAGYHRTNVLLHALASLAVFVFVRTLLRQADAWQAALGTAIFALHPIHTEAVDSVFNRSELLVTLCVVVALTLLARSEHDRPALAWGLVALLFLAALLCRESAIALPPLALLMLWLVQPSGTWRPTARSLAPVLLLAVPFGVYLRLREGALSGAAADPSPFFGVAPPTELLGRIFYALAQLSEYARMMVWPWPLRVSYEDFTGEGFRSAILIHGAALACALAARKRWPLVTFALAFFYTALLPSTQLMAAAGGGLHLGPFSLSRPALPLLINERIAYMPSVAVALLCAVGLGALSRRVGVSIAVACGALPAAGFAFVTWNRNLDWHDAERLYEAEVQAAPLNGDGWRHLIGAYSASGKLEQAVRACDAQLNRGFRSAYFFINCGSIYFQLGRDDAAIVGYRRAIELGLVAVGHSSLARVYTRQGRQAEAERELAAAVQAETNTMLRHFRKGQWLARFHPERRAEAIEELRKALALQPSYAPAQRVLQGLTQ